MVGIKKNVRFIFSVLIFTLLSIKVSHNAETGCLYRDYPRRMPPDIFSLWGCWGCYSYLNRYKPGMEIQVTSCRMKTYVIPCYNDTMYFDHTDEIMVEAIAATLPSAKDVNKWLQCCEAADACCARIEQPRPEPGTCDALWDGWECWEEAQPNTIPRATCPNYIYSGSGPTCDLYSQKECFSNATWNVQTDYTTCSHAPRLRFRHYFHVTILGIAIAISMPALVIFIACKRIRSNTRVILHRNLLLAIIIRNTLVILSKCLIILDELYATSAEYSNMAQNSAWCRIITTLEKLATNGVFACMALESVYLHRVLARSFKGQPNMVPYYIGASDLVLSENCLCKKLLNLGFTCSLFVLTWAIVMATMNDFYCWTLDMNNLGTHWINDSLRLTLLLVNLILLVDIVRVLLTRLRNVNTAHSSRIRRTAKATLLLAPVFGVQFLFTAIRPGTRDCGAEQAYYLSSYTLEALQGPLVAILYCYTNREVRQLLRAAWERQFGPLGSRQPRPSLVTDVTELPTTSQMNNKPSESNT